MIYQHILKTRLVHAQHIFKPWPIDMQYILKHTSFGINLILNFFFFFLLVTVLNTSIR